MVRLGAYKQVFEAHRDSFLAAGYPDVEASALAQAVVARPLPESALSRPAGYFESAMPSAFLLLEFNTFEGVSMKVNDAVQANQAMFADSDDPAYLELIVSGVFPGNPGMVIVKAENTDCWYAADWKLEGSDVKLSNVRPVGTYYDQLAIAVTEALVPALDLAYENMKAPLEVEEAFLTACVLGKPYDVEAVVLDGTRPVEEMEYVKFLRNSKVLSESFTTPFQMQETSILSNPADAVARLAMVIRAQKRVDENLARAIVSQRPPVNTESLASHLKGNLTEAGDMRNIGGHTVHVDEDKAAKGDLDHVSKQIETHNDMKKVLAKHDFKKEGNYGEGETHRKDEGNGYNTKVTLSGGKSHTAVHRNGGAVHKMIGTATTAESLEGHVNTASSAAASAPEVTGYGQGV